MGVSPSKPCPRLPVYVQTIGMLHARDHLFPRNLNATSPLWICVCVALMYILTTPGCLEVYALEVERSQRGRGICHLPSAILLSILPGKQACTIVSPAHMQNGPGSGNCLGANLSEGWHRIVRYICMLR
jgi:hypothetical protein